MDSQQFNQGLGFLKKRAGEGIAPRRMPSAEIEQLIQAAAFLGRGRQEGFSDEEILGNFARELVRERDRRLGGVDTRAAAAEAALVEAGLAPDEIEAKSKAEILRDEAGQGFAFEDDAQLAADGKRDVDRNAALRKRIAGVRGMRGGKKRDALLKKLEGDLAARQEKEMLFGAGVGRQQDPRQVDFFDPADTKGLLAAFDQDPLNPELQRLVAERAANIEGGRRLNLGNRQIEGEPLEFGRYISPTKDGQPVYVRRDQEVNFLGNDADGNPQFEFVPAERRKLNRGIQVPLRGKPGIALPEKDFLKMPDGEMIPVPRGLDKERGGFVIINGQRKWRERGRLFDSPEEAVPFRQQDVADEVFRPVVVGNSDSERRRLAEQDRAMGASEARRFERFERGDLTTEEMANMARLEAGRAVDPIRGRLAGPVQRVGGIGPVQAGVNNPDKPIEFMIPAGFATGAPDPVAFEGDPKPYSDTTPNLMVRRPDRVANALEGGRAAGAQGPRQAFGERAVRRKGVPGVVTPDDAKAAILGQLQARKANQGAARRDQQIRNLLAALDEAEGNLVANAMPGPAGVAPNETIREGRVEFGGIDAPNVHQVNDVLVGGGGKVNALGQIKADRQKVDMGLQLGDQRAIVGKAIRVENPDGSYRFVDAAGNDLAAPVEAKQVANSAQRLNAPAGGNDALDFIYKNQYEDRGAQFFGDEAILGQMNEKGAGGGIEQVDIQGALRGIEEKVAAKLGIPAKRINGVKGFQAAMNAVIANEQAKGRALIRLEDGKKVKVDNPGVEEALLALKVNPAEGRAIANALKQKELAVNEGVRIPGVKHAGHDVVTGVNDPRRGGDRMEIAKDVAFQGKLIRQGFDPVNKGPLQGEAIKPFIGLQAGDPRRAGGNQAQRGMDPVELRINQEARDRANIAKKEKRGIRVKPDNRGNNARIRQFQEGNVRARLRAAEAEAGFQARGKNKMGRIEGARDFGGNPFIGSGQQGRARAPHPKAKLKDRPVFRGDRQNMNPSPNVVEGAGEGIKIPAGFRPQNDQGTRPQGPTMRTEGRNAQQRIDAVNNQLTKFGLDPRTKRGRRIGYGIGGGTAALATILNLSNNEEEQG